MKPTGNNRSKFNGLNGVHIKIFHVISSTSSASTLACSCILNYYERRLGVSWSPRPRGVALLVVSCFPEQLLRTTMHNASTGIPFYRYSPPWSSSWKYYYKIVATMILIVRCLETIHVSSAFSCCATTNSMTAVTRVARIEMVRYIATNTNNSRYKSLISTNRIQDRQRSFVQDIINDHSRGTALVLVDDKNTTATAVASRHEYQHNLLVVKQHVARKEQQQEHQLQEEDQQQDDDGEDPDMDNVTINEGTTLNALLLTVFGYVFAGIVVFSLTVYLLHYFRQRWRRRRRSNRRTRMRQRGVVATQPSNERGYVLQQQELVVTTSSMTPNTTNHQAQIQPRTIPMGDATTTTRIPPEAGQQQQYEGSATTRSGRRRQDFYEQGGLSSPGDVVHVGPFLFPREMILRQHDDNDLSSDLETVTAVEDLISESSRSSVRSATATRSMNDEQMSTAAVMRNTRDHD